MLNTPEVKQWSGLEIAIIGMSGRFPGARTLEAFWQNIRDGVECITFFTDQDLLAAGVAPAMLRDPNYVKARATLEDIELFDAALFGITPREAEIMDPQHRLFLECAWEALEKAGYNTAAYAGSIGVYAGANMSNYALQLFANRDLLHSVGTMPLVLGNDKDYLCTRVSYKLNLEGPSIAVQTSCSTSLVAVYLACQGLLSGACDMALAGGVSISVPHKTGYLYQPGGMYAPDGHCRAFDARAQGTVSGSGVGIVVLKRLTDALNDGDTILALIKGSAVNNDGAAKVGYTAPRIDGQAQVIRVAHQMAEVAPESITYIEAHGTGTALGDPIEVAALTRAFRNHTEAGHFCALGSVKTNIGHLDAAAGIAGLIKTVLALQQRLLPPSLHFQQANPQIDFANSPFYVNTRLSAWPAGKTSRRAGVSSFGIGGTNAHVVLEEAPPLAPSGPSRAWQLLLLSAHTASALDSATTALVAYCKQHPTLNLADMAYTLQVGRRALQHRRALLCQDLAQALEGLETRDAQRLLTAFQESGDRPVVFMFPGQGSQYVHMGADLYHSEPQFREHVDCCAALLRPHLGLDLRDLMYPGQEHSLTATWRLTQTWIAQPAVFVTAYALARLWMAWGVRPQAMLGHSIGEYVAACLAGVFSLEDALALVAARGRLMQQLPAGAMLAVALPAPEIEAFLGTTLSLAAHNGPSACVVSGPVQAIARLEQHLQQRDVSCRRLQTSHAFHSAMLAPIIEPFLEQFHDLTLHSPGIPYVSNVTGTWITAEQATAPSYWAEHLRHTVRFAEGLHTVLQEPECLLLEVGPGHTLRTLARRHPARTPGQPVLASCPGRQDQASEAAWILRVLGQLWLAGVDVDWTGFSTLECRQRLALPSYPFERQRYWIEPHALTPPIVPRQPALARKPDIADWFYLPSWKRSMLPHARDARAAGQQTSCWIVFADACGLGERLVQRLQRQGHDVITVVQGEHFTRLGDTRYSLHPCRRDDYEALLQAVHNSEKRFSKIVHCWSITPEDAALAADAAFTQAQENGFYSVLFLAQALGERHNPEPLHIALVSNHLHDVAGGETLHPEKATLLGCCKVLPQEYPHLTCRSLDVVLPPVGSWQEAQLLEQMTAELCAPVEDAVVAYRGPHRWLQSFEPIRLSSPAARPSLLRDRGVYLITGGLGGIGLLLAAYLARTVQARLVLTGREGLPPRAAWEQLLAVNADADKQTDSAYAIHLELEKEISNFSRIEAEIASKLNIKDIEYYDNLKESLDTLCANYIYYYFKENNIDVKNCIIYHKDELKNILNISNKFDKFYEFMISELSKDHIISVIDNHIQFLTDNIMSPYDMKNNLDDIYPEFSGLFNLLDHCAKHYSAALRGDIEAISVLYPEGSTDLLREANENTIEHDNRRAYILLLQRILSRIIDSDKKIKILEIGGGAGRMTRDLISCLENKNIEYYFTDISKSFIVRAEQEAIKHNVKFMQFGILDISRDPEEQGYKNHSFDIVLALDVVHATSSIEKTLKNIKNLLTPNGLLCLIETVKARRWIDMIWGLAEGWWSFNDAHLRQNSPLLDLDTWEKVLQEQGFKCVQAFPQQATRRLATDYGLIMAQQQAERLLPHAPAGLTVRPQASAGLLRHQIRQVLQLEACGAEVLVCKADIANPQHMQACVRQACEHFGAIHGVIHTAAIAGGGLMQLQSPDLVQREFTPKVEGARLLTALFKPGQLDFLVFCSSLSSLTGGIGQVSYCAANAFLDALAHASTSRHDTYTVSINWDRWRQVGLAVAVEARHKALKGDEVDPEGMTAEEGVEAFHRLLSYQVVPQVVVSAEDFSAYLAQSRALRAEQALTTLIQDRPAVAVHPRPPLRQAYVAPRNEVEHRLADIWQAVFGIESVGMHDNFFELGGESLMALQLLNRLRTAFQVELSLKRFFEASTIAAVAEAIGHAGLSATVPAPAIVPLSREAYRSKRPS